MSKSRFPKRIVLGTGFPWAPGREPFLTVGLCRRKVGVNLITLHFPKALWQKRIPPYRLVLERVEEKP